MKPFDAGVEALEAAHAGGPCQIEPFTVNSHEMVRNTVNAMVDALTDTHCETISDLPCDEFREVLKKCLGLSKP